MFRECSTCQAKLGSPVLCEACLKNRSILSKIEIIREKLVKDFPELSFCGRAYTIKMLDDDLKNLGS